MSKFSMANNLALTVPGAPAPLPEGEVTELFSQEEGTGGVSSQNLSVYVTYSNFLPDTDVVSGFEFELLAIVEQQQDDNSWEEIGRQNTPIRKLEQGAMRQIVIGPNNVGIEEGVDFAIAGFGGVTQKLKSVFNDEASGKIRVRILAVDYNPGGAAPFEGVTVSIHGTRF